MKNIIFEWDDKKNKINQLKHRVSFDEALDIFYDGNAIEFDDPDHSIDENRYLLLGMCQSLKILVVSYSYRKRESRVRIISPEKQLRRSKKYISGGLDERRI